jgi:hypothetical protein
MNSTRKFPYQALKKKIAKNPIQREYFLSASSLLMIDLTLIRMVVTAPMITMAH